MKDYGFSTPTHFMVLICCSCTQCWLTFLSEPTGEIFCTRKCQTSCRIQEKKKKIKKWPHILNTVIQLHFDFPLSYIWYIEYSFYLPVCLCQHACINIFSFSQSQSLASSAVWYCGGTSCQYGSAKMLMCYREWLNDLLSFQALWQGLLIWLPSQANRHRSLLSPRGTLEQISTSCRSRWQVASGFWPRPNSQQPERALLHTGLCLSQIDSDLSWKD